MDDGFDTFDLTSSVDRPRVFLVERLQAWIDTWTGSAILPRFLQAAPSHNLKVLNYLEDSRYG